MNSILVKFLFALAAGVIGGWLIGDEDEPESELERLVSRRVKRRQYDKVSEN